MSFLPITLGIQIEGIGHAPAVESARVWGYKRWVVLGDPEKPEHWNDASLDELPRGVSSSVDPLLGRFDSASFVFELAATEDALITFASQGTSPFSNLLADLDANNTFVPCPFPGLDGVVVYIGRETIRLGVESPGTGYTGCDRGWHDSRAVAHGSGAGVYALPPRILRQVWLVCWDPTAGTLRRRWTGFLEDWETDDTMTRVQLRCSEFFSTIMKMRVGAGRDLSPVSSIRYVRNGGRAYSGVIRAATSVHKPIGDRWVTVQVGDALLAGYYDWDEGTITLDAATPLLGSLSGEDALITDDEVGTEVREPIFEVYMISPELDRIYPGVSALTGFWSPYNRLAAGLALLSSTKETLATLSPKAADYVEVDIHGAAWGLGLDGELDTDTWDEQVFLAEEIPEIDQLLLGWDGARENVFDVVNNKLMRPWGRFFALSEDGRLGAASLGGIDVRDFCEAQSRGITVISPKFGGTLKFDGNGASALGRITAKVGELPWRKPSTLEIRALDVTTQQLDLAEPRETTYDLSTIARANLAELGDGDAADGILLELVDRVALMHGLMPRLTVVARDSRLDAGLDFSLGKKVSIKAGLPEDARIPVPRAGEPAQLLALADVTSNDQKVRLIGTIVDRDFITKNQAWMLTLLLTGYSNGVIGRLRAPSAKMIHANPAENKLIIPPGSIFGHLEDADPLSFEVGDDIELWTRTGQKWADSEVREIVEVDELEITLDGWFDSNPASASPLYIRLATSESYSNDVHVACFERPFFYLADALDTINELGDDVEADSYG